MIPGRHSAFFADGRSGRQQIPGTIAREEYLDDTYLTTGLENGAEGKEMPYPVTWAVLKRGQERFNVYCSPCHSRVGNGKGEIVARGFAAAGDLQSTRLREAPLGHYFYVMTHGYGAMPDYAAQITPEDRWAVAAYIRALQLSQSAPRGDVPSGVHIAHIHDVLTSAKLSRDFLDGWDAGEDEDSGPSGISATAHVAKATSKHATEADARKGNAIYLKNCAACHRPSRTGIPPMFPSLLGIVDKDGEGKVRRVIKNGIPDAQPPMPAHPGLTESDIDDLIAFLRTK
ncbi:MAG: c-type cytochrome [Terracidiphilus sp.]